MGKKKRMNKKKNFPMSALVGLKIAEKPNVATKIAEKPNVATKIAEKPNVAKKIAKKQNMLAKIETAQQKLTVTPFSWKKMCRLCETNNGPFINIFAENKNAAKKISYILPFEIAENDGLPHKICFRCSAKIEELYEYIEKWIKTQTNLSKAIGRKGPVFTKVQTRIQWEEVLNDSNFSNDDLCDAVIKKAMEGIKSIDQAPMSTNVPRKLRNDSFQTSLESITEADDEFLDTEQGLPQPTPKPTSTANNRKNLVNSASANNVKEPLLKKKAQEMKYKKSNNFKRALNTTRDTVNKIIKKEKDVEVDSMNAEKCAEAPAAKPFDIMDYVTALKVNGVGTIYQCELCNRNFFNKNVLLSHGCTTQKSKLKDTNIQPVVPKTPLVKYINTNENKTESENNDTIPNVETKKSEVKLYRPGPKSRKGPASVQNVMHDTSTVNLNAVDGPSASKETTKRPNTDANHETPPKIVRLHHSSESTSSNAPKPYPVGLFQTVPHHSRVTSEPPPFYASEAKRKSCIVYQTDCPGKLVISTKPPIVEAARKPTTNNEPRRITLGTVTPATGNAAKTEQYFTVIDVDPSAQPSYVLPIGNSSQDHNLYKGDPKSKSYTCNLCNETFTREQKLLVHLKSHYSKMDAVFRRRCEKAGPALNKKF